MATVLYTAVTLFLIMNPTGNLPVMLTFVKHLPFAQQKRILLRESCIAVLIAYFFQLLGRPFLDLIQIQNFSLSVCGGILLILFGIQMIFPHHEDDAKSSAEWREPFIVPLATPLLTGPGTITFIMFYSKQLPATTLSAAIFFACSGMVLLAWNAPYLLKLLGKRGLYALEQIMGMVLIMMGVQMLIGGIRLFTLSLGGTA